jgi:hypothetical protein
MNTVVYGPEVCQECRAVGHGSPCPVPLSNLSVEIARYRAHRQDAFAQSVVCSLCGSRTGGTFDLLKRRVTCHKCGGSFEFDETGN